VTGRGELLLLQERPRRKGSPPPQTWARSDGTWSRSRGPDRQSEVTGVHVHHYIYNETIKTKVIKSQIEEHSRIAKTAKKIK
jgi:hypothetical protein